MAIELSAASAIIFILLVLHSITCTNHLASLAATVHGRSVALLPPGLQHETLGLLSHTTRIFKSDHMLHPAPYGLTR